MCPPWTWTTAFNCSRHWSTIRIRQQVRTAHSCVWRHEAALQICLSDSLHRTALQDSPVNFSTFLGLLLNPGLSWLVKLRPMADWNFHLRAFAKFVANDLPYDRILTWKWPCTVTEKGGKIPPWGGMQQIFHPHVTKGGEEGGKLLFSTITWWKT